jgi:uncharacterized protein (DUF488 family)
MALRRSPSDSADQIRAPTVWTIGHGTRTTDELAALLHDAGIRTLIDVRRYPASRRQPHLSREALSVSLPAAGIGYEWWGDALGGRRTPSSDAQVTTGWRNPAFAGYAQFMATPAFREALMTLEERARAGERLSIMCAETVWWRCHRRLIADALVRDGFAVEHLIDRAPGRPHPRT